MSYSNKLLRNEMALLRDSCYFVVCMNMYVQNKLDFALLTF